MQIDDRILHCTTFIGTPTQVGFSADGTGFFMEVRLEGLSFLYVVTCRHVIRSLNPTAEELAKPIWIRVNRDNGKPARTIETKVSDWIAHTDKHIDVCVLPFNAHLYDNLQIGTLRADTIVLTPEAEARWGLHLGDDVFMIGAFVGQVGEQNNIPVARVGNIAAKPAEPMWGSSHRHPAFLIETKSLGGISGSPVFLHTRIDRTPPSLPMVTQTDEGELRTPYFLFAMMQGMHGGQYASDFSMEQKIIPTDAEFNAGLGVAIPISQVIEVLDRDELKESRLKAIEAKHKLTGARDTSVLKKDAAPPTGDANPNHREDFTALLNAALKKPKPAE